MMIDKTELILEKLGWDCFFRKHFQLLKVPGSLPARVVSEHRNSYQVCSQYGELSEAKQVGVTVGVASMVNHAGMIVMPPLFGYLVDISSYSLGWRVAAAVALVCTLALLAFGREP